MTDPTRDPVQDVLARLEGVKQAGEGQYMARCPAHGDGHASLSVGRGDDGRALIDCKAGCNVADVLNSIGLNMKDLFPPTGPADRPSATTAQGNGKAKRIAATYDYRDSAGALLFQVVRFDPKDFRQRRPDESGGWTWKLDGVPPVLYGLPELQVGDSSEWVFVVEGERDADNLAALGLLATTNPGGAGKWGKLADDSALYGRRVAIIADKDKAGATHAQDVAARLHGKAAVVKIIELPAGEVDGRPIKDTSDWLDSLDSRTPEDLAAALVSMAEEAPAWTPTADGPSAPSAMPEPVLTSLADVTPRPVEWLWPSRIAIGKLTLIAGDPGLGKSFITLDMAARVSTGNIWPDGIGGNNGPGGVVILNAEDDLADTVRPRLDAAGADVSRIKALVAVKHFDFEAGRERQHPFNLAEDLDALEQAIRDVADCRFVVIDPISAYLGRTDSHKNAEIRGLLVPLSELAARHGVALVAVTHLRKGEGPAMYRAMGSLGFVAAARAAYAVTKDKDDSTGQRRLVLPVKNNLGNDRTGLAYRLDDAFSANGQPVVKWEAGPVEISADDALCPDNGRDEGDSSALDEARDWLQDSLAGGPRSAKEVVAEARADGIAKRTLDRAKKDLGIIAAKTGFDAGWTWRLPDSEGPLAQERPDPRQEGLATFGDAGDLLRGPSESAGSGNAPGGGPPEDCQAAPAGDVRANERKAEGA